MKLLKTAVAVFLYLLAAMTGLEAQNMAFLRDDVVMTCGLNGEKPQKVCESYDFDISPDGRFLAYVADNRLAYIDIAEKKVHRFNSIPNNGLHTIRWSPDGRKIAFNFFWESGRSVWQIAVVNADDTGFKILTEKAWHSDLFSPTWDPSGNTIFCHNLTNIYAVDANGNNNMLATATFSDQVAFYARSSADAVELSSDGRFVLFSGAVDEVIPDLNDAVSAVFVYEIAADKTTRLTPPGICAINPRWISAEEIAFEGFGAKDIKIVKHKGLDDESVILRRIYRIKVDGTGMQTLIENAGRPAVSGAVSSLSSSAASDGNDELFVQVKNIEARLKARAGVAVYDTTTGKSWNYKSDERFPMCSTFKTLACAALLYSVDNSKDRLDRVLPITRQDIASYSPVTELHVGGNMSLSDLCAATMKLSDNTAANLILDAIGGPASLTAFIRMTGDTTTRLDRRETDLNEGAPGDARDTTTPAAMAKTVERLVLGEILSPKSRQQLKDWMIANEVAGSLVRAGVPADWVVADRSGAGGHGSRAVVAVMWPPQSDPIIAAIYITETEASFDERNAAIAEIGRAISQAIAKK